MTTVFILNGNAYGAARPDRLTQVSAVDLARRGFHAIQLKTPAMDSLGTFDILANQLKRLSKGRPIGLVGFSAGGSMAMRLAQNPGLNVKAVLNFYGPPDLRDWIDEHRLDPAFAYMNSQVHLTPGFINRMSGSGSSQTFIVSAFGLRDRTVTASASGASFQKDYPNGALYYYPGAHGVTIAACYEAYLGFVSHL
jgi:dienelactone hydrolase